MSILGVPFELSQARQVKENQDKLVYLVCIIWGTHYKIYMITNKDTSLTMHPGLRRNSS